MNGFVLLALTWWNSLGEGIVEACFRVSVKKLRSSLCFNILNILNFFLVFTNCCGRRPIVAHLHSNVHFVLVKWYITDVLVMSLDYELHLPRELLLLRRFCHSFAWMIYCWPLWDYCILIMRRDRSSACDRIYFSIWIQKSYLSIYD